MENNKVEEYRVVEAVALDNLMNDVNSLIKEGWQPIGGATSVWKKEYEDEHWHQAMIRCENKELTQAQKQNATCPFKKIVDLYHEFCPNLKPYRWDTEKGKVGMRRLWQKAGGFRDKDRDGAWNFLRVFFQAANESPFLRGEELDPKYPGYTGGYLEMICRDEWIARIMKGEAG